MRILTLNANGIRSAESKGFFEWVKKQDMDVICVQETKAQIHQLDSENFKLAGYQSYFFDAEKKGYSGVALYTRLPVKQLEKGLGFDIADKEGRYLQVDFDEVSVASLYLPSGSSGPEKQANKFIFLEKFKKKLKEIIASKRSFILCGDWNIAHKEIDLKNWRANQKNSGFLPEERAWLDQLFGEMGFVDAFRVINQEPEQYTWWSHRGQAWHKNVGWRIDYQVITSGLAGAVKQASIYRDHKFSDHAPLGIV